VPRAQVTDSSISVIRVEQYFKSRHSYRSVRDL